MSKPLSSLLAREQFAFLAREKGAWGEHLDRVRALLGEGLQAADPSRPVLILGAGSGLEVPWALAPPSTVGWDADPWSRMWTLLRHRRFPPWVFEDLTGGLRDLDATTRRAAGEPWSGRRRDRDQATRRLAGLLPSLRPQPKALQAWIATHQPGTILVANVMGQFGVVAERVVEGALGFVPWEPDPERTDPLAEALEAWTGRALAAFLGALAERGAALWMVHDRAVGFGEGALELGPWEDLWIRQLRSHQGLEINDPLGGVDVLAQMQGLGRKPLRKERWIWPLAPGQCHVVEGLAFA